MKRKVSTKLQKAKALLTKARNTWSGQLLVDITKASIVTAAMVLVAAYTLTTFTENYMPPAFRTDPPPVQVLPIEKPPIKLNQVSQGTIDARVRLHTKDGRFFCSGTVIAKNYVLTAGHCIMDESWGITSDTILIVSDDQKYSVESQAVAANFRGDTGLITGDFSKFQFAQIETDSFKIFFETEGPFQTCGYPWGGKRLCLGVMLSGVSNFMLEGVAILFPGMSGGGLFSETTGKIIGVNSQIIGEKLYGSRFAVVNELLDQMNIKEE